MRRRRATSLALFGSLALAGLARGADLSLSAAWQAAITHDPTFAAARAQRDAGRTQDQQALALWLPTLSATGSTGRGDLDSHTRGAAFAAPGFGSTTGVDFRTSITGGTATRWSIMAEQPLFDAARLAGARELRTGARQAQVQFHAAEQALALRTARSYFDVLNARATVESLQRLRAAAERARAVAQGRYEAGDIPVTDMREAQATADSVGVQQLEARDALALAQAGFTDLTGLDAGSLQPPAPDAGLDAAPPESLETWTQRALAGNPQLAAQRLAAERAGAEVGRYGALTSPRLSIVAQAGREALSGDGDFGSAGVTQRQAAVALQASIPLFTGGMRSAQRHEARALQRAAEAGVAAAELEVRQQTRAAWLRLTTAAARVQALERLHQSAASRLDATRIGVESGGRTVLDLLGAEGDYLRTDADLTRAQTDWLYARLELAATAGELGESELGAVDRHLVAPAAPVP